MFSIIDYNICHALGGTTETMTLSGALPKISNEVWKYSKSAGLWTEEAALVRPTGVIRSYYFNNNIWHLGMIKTQTSR